MFLGKRDHVIILFSTQKVGIKN